MNYESLKKVLTSREVLDSARESLSKWDYSSVLLSYKNGEEVCMGEPIPFNENEYQKFMSSVKEPTIEDFRDINTVGEVLGGKHFQLRDKYFSLEFDNMLETYPNDGGSKLFRDPTYIITWEKDESSLEDELKVKGEFRNSDFDVENLMLRTLRVNDLLRLNNLSEHVMEPTLIKGIARSSAKPDLLSLIIQSQRVPKIKNFKILNSTHFFEQLKSITKHKSRNDRVYERDFGMLDLNEGTLTLDSDLQRGMYSD